MKKILFFLTIFCVSVLAEKLANPHDVFGAIEQEQQTNINQQPSKKKENSGISFIKERAVTENRQSKILTEIMEKKAVCEQNHDRACLSLSDFIAPRALKMLIGEEKLDTSFIELVGENPLLEDFSGLAADFYAKGIGVKKDLTKAIKMVKRSTLPIQLRQLPLFANIFGGRDIAGFDEQCRANNVDARTNCDFLVEVLIDLGVYFNNTEYFNDAKNLVDDACKAQKAYDAYYGRTTNMKECRTETLDSIELKISEASKKMHLYSKQKEKIKEYLQTLE